MASIKEDVMMAVLTRLSAPTPIVSKTRLRRTHRTTVTRENAPAAHLIDGTDKPIDPKDNCETEREAAFTVSLFVRNDDGYAEGDALARKVMERLDPMSDDYQPYPHNARMNIGPITTETDIADGDALRIDMEFNFRYRVAGWSLDAVG